MKIPSAAVAAVITLASLAIAAVATSAVRSVTPDATAAPVTGALAIGANSASATAVRPAAALKGGPASVAHGRYLVATAGCNDCHTAGYARSGGRAPSTNWLTGSDVGFQGPWGTTYPANLRLTVQSMTEAQWLVFARAERRPPMPWFNLREMSDVDLTDIYRFIRSLGAAGIPAPPAAPPGVKVNTPFIVLEPQNLSLGGPTMSQAAPPRSEPRG